MKSPVDACRIHLHFVLSLINSIFRVSSEEWEWLDQKALCSLKGAMVLYDMQTKRRISEISRFRVPRQSTGKNVLFDVENMHGDIVMLVRLEKPFEGDVGTWLDTVAKGKCADIKASASYWQPFGWAAIHLGEELKSCSGSGMMKKILETDYFYRFDDAKLSDADLVQTFLQVNLKQARKPRHVPIKVQFIIEESQFGGEHNVITNSKTIDFPVRTMTKL
jgi:hypothetical protein